MSNSPCAKIDIAPDPQQVILDDTSSQITYVGAWSAERQNIYDGYPSYNYTAHILNVTRTAFSIAGRTITNTSIPNNGAVGYNHSCVVDGETQFNSSAKNLLCGADNLPDGNHQVSFSAEADIDGAFSVQVDAIQYTPTSAELAASHPGVLVVDICDASVDYGSTVSSWTTYRAPGNLLIDPSLGFASLSRGVSTEVYGTQLRYNFMGTRIQGLATILSVADGGSTSAHLGSFNATIDGETKGIYVPTPQSSLTVYNQVVFQSSELPAGNHSLVITYLGQKDFVPLPLSYLVVDLQSAKTSTSSPKSQLGSILGGVLGGVFGLILVLVAGWIGYSRRQRRIEKRAWGVTWRNRQREPEDLELKDSPKPDKTTF